MTTKAAKNMVNIDGQWWYVPPNGNRSRCLEWKCEACERPFLAIASARRRFCSRLCALKSRPKSMHRPGPMSHCWRGGKTKNRGYVRVHSGERNPSGGARYVPEHRLVMERVLGRKLLKTEHVHHINGNRSDNRPENLELWNRHHPYGVRASDANDWPIGVCVGGPVGGLTIT